MAERDSTTTMRDRARFEDDAHFRGAETLKSLSELIEEYKKKRGLE